MIYKCTMPAKTFVLGEYSVTGNGKAVVLLSEPCFEASFSAGSQPGLSSPIEKFIGLYPKELSNVCCDFVDPYQGIGGFGSSSAEFLAWIKYCYHMKGEEFDIANGDHYKQALQDFIACSSSATGLRPSGADMIAQNSGGLAFVDLACSNITNITWPFKGVDICLAHTKNKVATHEHLAKIKSGGDFSCLSRNVDRFKESLVSNCLDGVVGSINSSCTELDRLGFLHPRSKEIINSALKHDFCLAAKGCGAMGADVILFVYHSSFFEKMKKFLNSEGLDLTFRAGSHDL